MLRGSPGPSGWAEVPAALLVLTLELLQQPALRPPPAASDQLLGGGFQKGGLASGGTHSEVWCSLSSSCKQGLTQSLPSSVQLPSLA